MKKPISFWELFMDMQKSQNPDVIKLRSYNWANASDRYKALLAFKMGAEATYYTNGLLTLGSLDDFIKRIESGEYDDVLRRKFPHTMGTIIKLEKARRVK